MPAVLDTAKTRRTLERLTAYYGSKGYFNNNTTFEIDTLKKRRANVAYKIDLGKPFVVESIARDIKSSAIDSIYDLNKDESFIKEGNQFDLARFAGERERLSKSSEIPVSIIFRRALFLMISQPIPLNSPTTKK